MAVVRLVRLDCRIGSRTAAQLLDETSLLLGVGRNQRLEVDPDDGRLLVGVQPGEEFVLGAFLERRGRHDLVLQEHLGRFLGGAVAVGSRRLLGVLRLERLDLDLESLDHVVRLGFSLLVVVVDRLVLGGLGVGELLLEVGEGLGRLLGVLRLERLDLDLESLDHVVRLGFSLLVVVVDRLVLGGLGVGELLLEVGEGLHGVRVVKRRVLPVATASPWPLTLSLPVPPVDSCTDGELRVRILDLAEQGRRDGRGVTREVDGRGGRRVDRNVLLDVEPERYEHRTSMIPYECGNLDTRLLLSCQPIFGQQHVAMRSTVGCVAVDQAQDPGFEFVLEHRLHEQLPHFHSHLVGFRAGVFHDSLPGVAKCFALRLGTSFLINRDRVGEQFAELDREGGLGGGNRHGCTLLHEVRGQARKPNRKTG